MTRWGFALHAILGISMGSAFCQASAADPLGLYVGGAVGHSTVRADQVVFVERYYGTALNGPVSFSKSTTGWKVVAGLRPISLMGAEFAYIDFGNPTVSHTPRGAGLGYHADMRAKATAAFDVLYAPIPVPLLDVYVKAGLARLQTTVNATALVGCFPPLACAVYGGEFHRDRTETGFAYGAGVQVKVSALGIRAEYERISASGGDPDLLSLGIIWTFGPSR
jgi:opacity protein-like surface antigen